MGAGSDFILFYFVLWWMDVTVILIHKCIQGKEHSIED